MMEMTQTTKGMMLMAASNVAFCAMACLVRLTHGVSAYTATLFRFGMGVVVIGVLAATGMLSLTFVNKRGLLWRGLLGGGAISLSFLAIMNIGIVKASIILFSYPLFATLFGAIILHERVGRAELLAILAAFVGVCVVVGAGDTSPGSHGPLIGFYEVLAVVSAVIGGLAVVFVKQLQETESSASIYLAQCVVGLVMVVVPAGATTHGLPISGIAILIGMGLLATAGQLVMTEGYRYIPVSTAAIFVLMAPVLNVAAGVMFFAEPLNTNIVAGGTIVMTACGVLIWTKRSRPRSKIPTLKGDAYGTTADV